jgi:hypothetical protein
MTHGVVIRGHLRQVLCLIHLGKPLIWRNAPPGDEAQVISR